VVEVALVTGAGSGVGRAVGLALARRGWRVALVGRRADALRATLAALSADAAARCSVHACDIGRAEAVDRLAAEVAAAHGGVQVLVNAAGTNIPRRALVDLSRADYHAVVDTNLHGSYYCAQAVLPGMRAQGRGTIVNVVSIAGIKGGALSGAAYVVSKFAQAGLTDSINAEENARGIRACAVFPGDIATELLEKRPEPPPAEARARMLSAEDVAACVLLAIDLPERAVVERLIVRPRIS